MRKRIERARASIFRLGIGLALYVFDREFRRTVNGKLTGPDDAVATSETVVAVLRAHENGRPRRVIR